MYIPEKVTVGFHEGKRILMPEKIGVSAIAMPESEYGQIKLGFDTVNKKKNFTPVKLGNASRIQRSLYLSYGGAIFNWNIGALFN